MARLGLIGGTGLDDWGVDYQSLDQDTPWGPASGPVQSFSMDGNELLFLPRHGATHNIPPHAVNYRANVATMKALGAECVLAVNAVGGIAGFAAPAALVLPDQLIDYTWGRKHTFSDGPDMPLEHVEFGQPFDTPLRHLLVTAAECESIMLHDGGCIGVTQGPRLETEAEVRKLAVDGCDLVGMTSMPEAALAREAGLPYLSLCVVSNRAAGLESEPVSMADIERNLETAMDGVRQLIGRFISDYAR